MDGVHDLGGKQGFGPVRYASSRTAFKAEWEPRANALYSLGVRLGLINMDEYRHAIERMEPRHYLSASYYERSLTGFATLCVEKGIVSQEELERLAEGSFPLSLPSAEGRLNAMPRESFASATECGSRTSSSPVMSACRATSAARRGSSSAYRRPIHFRTLPPTICNPRTSAPMT
jgi:nitrile hydratase